MRGVSIADFKEALIDGRERVAFNAVNRLYEKALWDDRECLIGKFLREPDYDGGSGRDTYTAFIGVDYSWREKNAMTDWRRLNTLSVCKHECTGHVEVCLSCAEMSTAFLPGLNRDSTIELSEDEFKAELDSAMSRFTITMRAIPGTQL